MKAKTRKLLTRKSEEHFRYRPLDLPSSPQLVNQSIHCEEKKNEHNI